MFLKSLMQWVHVGSVVLMIGGFFFLRVVLLPVARRLPKPETLISSALRRFSGVVWTALLTVLISGLYNFITFFRAARSVAATGTFISGLLALYPRLGDQTVYCLFDIHISDCSNIPLSCL